jgi:aminoglycoside phosphotransferase family enzyme/predicted kinase
MDTALARQEILVAALRSALGVAVEVLETHISWVLLAGDYAYKIKKAVNLGFLDFSTLEKRRFYCGEELRLNRRLAPDLYLEVVPVAGSADHPAWNGTGPAIEYAVKMRRFPQASLLDQVLLRGELTSATVDAIARRIADFHEHTAVADDESPFGTPERTRLPVAENFAQIRPRLRDDADLIRLNELSRWSEREYQARFKTLAVRKARGMIRECHGDLHLGNMALLGGEAVPFDCIEFSDNLRWIDVISEAAFLNMDLQDRGRPDLARRFLNAYLEQTGDYEGLEVLRYYLVYRAMVRAKVACIRAGQAEQPAGHWTQYRNHIELAAGFTRPFQPFLAITHGLSGSGKTTVTQSLLEAASLFRVRSDVERKRLYGLKPEARSSAGAGEGIYSVEANERTYRRLAEVARGIVQSGYPAIVDAAFLKRRERAAFHELAQELGVPFVILDVTAPENLLRERVKQRMQRGRDASEADIAVLENQLRNSEALDSSEQAATIGVDTERAVNAQALVQRLTGMTNRHNRFPHP